MDNMDQKAVETLCQAIIQTVKQSSTDPDIVAMVTEVNGSNCKVSIQGNIYEVKNGTGVTFTVGDRALVHLINGNFNNKIIIAKM